MQINKQIYAREIALKTKWLKYNDYNYESIRFAVRQGSLNLSKIYNIWNDNINTRFRKFLQTHLISGTPDVLAASDLYPIPVIFYKCPDTILYKIRV